MAKTKSLVSGDELVELLGNELRARGVVKVLQSLGIGAQQTKDAGHSGLNIELKQQGLRLVFYREEQGQHKGKLTLNHVEFSKPGIALPRGLQLRDQKHTVHQVLGKPTQVVPRHRMEVFSELGWAEVVVEYSRARLSKLTARYVAPRKVQGKGRVKVGAEPTNSSPLGMASRTRLVTGLVRKALAVYRDQHFFSKKPAVKPMRVALEGGQLKLSCAGVQLTGRLSALSLVCEEYWSRVHDLLAIRGVPQAGEALDALIAGVDEEYSSAIQLLLDMGELDEALLCMAQLQTVRANSGADSPGELEARLSAEQLESVDFSARHDVMHEAMFGRRSKATRRVLLTNLVEHAPRSSAIERRDMLLETVELLMDWETPALMALDLLLPAVTDAISDREPSVQEMGREVLDALAAKLVDARAYEQALPVIELALQHRVNLPLQHARRWECRFCRGDRARAAKDWDEFMRHLGQVLRHAGAALKSPHYNVWNQGRTFYTVNWRAYKSARLKNVALYALRRSRAQSPIDSFSTRGKSKPKSQKLTAAEQQQLQKLEQLLAQELENCNTQLENNSAEVYRARQQATEIGELVFPVQPYLVDEGRDVDEFLRQLGRRRVDSA